MAKNGLLGPDVLFSHANNTSSEELALLKTAGAHISSTPLTEMQMGHGYPICLQPDFFDISSLGIDCHSFCSASLPVQMLAILQSTRAKRFSDLMAMNQWDASVGPTVEDVYNLGTIKGARAIKLENQVGSLEVGKKADLVIFDKSTPSMRVVAERNPVASIVFHSSVRDIKMVIIDGVIRKEQFKLTPLRICKDIYDENENENEVCQEPLDWEGVGQKIDQSYKEMEARITETVDEEVARDGLIKGFLEMLGSIASN